MLDRKVINVAPFGGAIFRKDMIGASKNNFYLTDNIIHGDNNDLIARNTISLNVKSTEFSPPFVKNRLDNACYGDWYDTDYFLYGVYDGSAATDTIKIYSVDFTSPIGDATLISTITSSTFVHGLKYGDGCNFDFIQDASNVYFVCGDNKYRTWDKDVSSPTITEYTSGLLSGLDRFECIEEFDKRPFLVPVASNNIIIWGDDIDDWTDFSNMDNFEYVGDTSEQIVDIVSWGGYLIIFKEQSIYLLSGNADPGYSLQKVSGNFGAIGKHLIDKSDDGVYFVSSDRRLMVFNGGSFSEIQLVKFLLKDIVIEAYIKRDYKLKIADRKIFIIYQNGMTGYVGYIYVYDIERELWYRMITNDDTNTDPSDAVIPQRITNIWPFPNSIEPNGILMASQDYSLLTHSLGRGSGYVRDDNVFGFNKTSETIVTGTNDIGLFFNNRADLITQKLPGTGIEDEYRKRFRRVFIDIEGIPSNIHFVYSVDGEIVKDYKLSSSLVNERIRKWIRLDNPIGQNITLRIVGEPSFNFSIRKLEVEYDIISIRRSKSGTVVSTDYDDPF